MTYCPYEHLDPWGEWGDVTNPMGSYCMECSDKECVHNENFDPEYDEELLEFYRDMKVSHSPMKDDSGGS